MTTLIFVGLILLNLGISWWNARVCGQVWDEARALGGWLRLVVWSGAVQSAVGFSSVVLLVVGGGAYATGYLPKEAVKPMTDLWYVLVIVPALMSGWIITIHSWIELWRERSLTGLAATSWNTYASISNTYNAVTGMGDAFGSVGKLFEGDGDDVPGAVAMVVLFIVAFSLASGVIITWLIIKSYRRTLALPKIQRPAYG